MASRRKDFFPDVTDEQWNDWHWQVKNRIETLEQLKKYLKLTPEEEAPAEAAEEVSTDAAQEEFDVIGGSDNKPEQL